MFNLESRIIHNGLYSEQEFITKDVNKACKDSDADSMLDGANKMKHVNAARDELDLSEFCSVIPGIDTRALHVMLLLARRNYRAMHFIDQGIDDDGRDVETPFDALIATFTP